MFRILNLETGRYLEWPEYTTTKEILDKKYINKEPEKVPTEFCNESVAEAYLEKYRCDHAYSAMVVFEGDTQTYYRLVKPSWDLFKIIDTSLKEDNI